MSTFHEYDTINITVVAANDIKSNDSNGLSDAYVQITTPYGAINTAAKDGVVKTEVVKKSLNPKWHSNNVFFYSLFLAVEDIEFKIELYDWNLIKKNVLIDSTVLKLKHSDLTPNTETSMTVNWNDKGTLEVKVVYKPDTLSTPQTSSSSTSTAYPNPEDIEFDSNLYKQVKFGNAIIPLVPKKEKLDEVTFNNKAKVLRCFFDDFNFGVMEFDSWKDYESAGEEYSKILSERQISIARTLASECEQVKEDVKDVTDQFSSRFKKVLLYRWKFVPAFKFAKPRSFSIFIGFTDSTTFVESVEIMSATLKLTDSEMKTIVECFNKSILKSRVYTESLFPNKFKDRTPLY